MQQWRERPGPHGCSSSCAAALGPRGESWSPRPPTRMMVGNTLNPALFVIAFLYLFTFVLLTVLGRYAASCSFLHGRPGLDWGKVWGISLCAALCVLVQLLLCLLASTNACTHHLGRCLSADWFGICGDLFSTFPAGAAASLGPSSSAESRVAGLGPPSSAESRVAGRSNVVV